VGLQKAFRGAHWQWTTTRDGKKVQMHCGKGWPIHRMATGIGNLEKSELVQVYKWALAVIRKSKKGSVEAREFKVSGVVRLPVREC
jgi:hypothetical protein